MNKNKKNYLKNIFDIFTMLSLILVVVFEVTGKININLNDKIVPELIITLLPTIITIVSISLSLAKEEVYGVSLGDFAKLRKKSIYSFVHMVIIMALSILLYTIFYLLSANISIIVLDCFAFVYSMIFLIQEIPFLVRNKNRLKNIIKFKYDNIDKDELFLTQSDNKTLYDIIQYIVLNEGFITAYSTLEDSKKNNTKSAYNSCLISYLIKIQNEYLLEVLETQKTFPQNLWNEYKNISILKSISTAYSNVKILLFGENEINKNVVINIDSISLLKTTIFELHELSINLNLNDDRKLQEIINEFLLSYFNQTNSKEILQFIMLLLIDSLKKGETWFFESLRNTILSPQIQFLSNKYLFSFGLFISIYLSYILDNNLLDKEKSAKILKECSTVSIDNRQSWKQLISRSIEFAKQKIITESLTELVAIYDVFPNEQYFVPWRTNNYINFSKADIINSWLEIIIFNNHIDISEKDVENVINDLDEKTKKIFIDTCLEKWIKNNQLNNDYQIKFLNLFSMECFTTEEENYNKTIIKFLINITKDTIKKEKINKYHNHQEDAEKINKKIKDEFLGYIYNSEFYTNEIELSKENSKCFVVKVTTDNLDCLLDYYLEQLKHSLAYSFREEIELSLKPELINDNNLNEQQISKIMALNPDKHSLLSNFNYNFYESLKDIKLVKNEMLPNNLYFQDGAIKINVEYDEKHSGIKVLNDGEISDIIENDYQEINGLYRLSEVLNDTNTAISCLVTREELVKILKEKTRYIFVVYKKKLSIDINKCLLFKRSD